MAVLDSFPDLKVEIIVNGNPLTEYVSDDENEEVIPDTSTTFVEATTGAEFLIRCGFGPKFKFKKYAISTDVEMDGAFMTNEIKEPRSTRRTRWLELSSRESCLHDGIWQRQNFAFSPLQIDEATRMKLEDLGSIIVSMYRVKVTRTGEDSNSEYTFPTASMSQTEFSEKAVKGRAISHCINLQPARKCDAPNLLDVEDIDPLDSPFAVFIFKYRSLQALKDLRLVSRSPSPIPIEDRPVEELDLEQLREIARKAQAQRNTLPTQTKREFKEEPEDDDDEGVSFVEQRPCKVARISDGPVETIDLT